MKTIVLLCACLLLGTASGAQTDCRVLLPDLSGSYTGECRGGLAHGTGTASGLDTYTGQFRRGLPHGQGTYTWHTGEVHEGRWRRGQAHGLGVWTRPGPDGTETVVEGVWQNGELMPEYMDARHVYQVGRITGIESVRVLPATSGGSRVIYQVTRGGLPLRVFDMAYSSSSGFDRQQGHEVRFEEVEFPFTARFRYRVNNVLRTGSITCELEITIDEPGSWMIVTSQ